MSQSPHPSLIACGNLRPSRLPTSMAMLPAFGSKSKDRHGAGRSPFRYPGGKAFIADALEERICDAPSPITAFAEAYAGGAGAAVELLARGTVDRIILNDFDRRVFAAWWAILHRTADFVERITSTPVDMDTWYACRSIVENASRTSDMFDLGFAVFFLNRTNHSGVILGAGPIGGYSQTGKWLIDARFYRDTMIKRINWLGDRRDKIELSNQDGLEFLRSFSQENIRDTFFFIDPPYVQAGAKLYMNAMSDQKHRDLATFLTGEDFPARWLVTYDDCDLINDAYSRAGIERMPVRYSLHNKRTEHEVCISMPHAA
jgi:DNA adenine methylase